MLFYLSWRLGPILALVIIATAAAAANYKKQTKLVEGTASKALSDMVGVADQAFRAITTVRCAGTLHPKRALQQAWCMGTSCSGAATRQAAPAANFCSQAQAAAAPAHAVPSRLCGCLRRSFAGEGLERERFAEHAMESYRAGVGFAGAKANLESLNRWNITPCLLLLHDAFADLTELHRSPGAAAFHASLHSTVSVADITMPLCLFCCMTVLRRDVARAEAPFTRPCWRCTGWAATWSAEGSCP